MSRCSQQPAPMLYQRPSNIQLTTEQHTPTYMVTLRRERRGQRLACWHMGADGWVVVLRASRLVFTSSSLPLPRYTIFSVLRIEKKRPNFTLFELFSSSFRFLELDAETSGSLSV